jgi:branched-chain amino acid transport system ATP-binding protein
MGDPITGGGALLEVRQLEVVYNRIATAVQGVTLDVPQGGIVAIIGTNGAGKTTTLRAVSGFLPAEDVAITDGSIRFRGEVTNGRLPHDLSRIGVVLVPERNKVFDTLTVRENLLFSYTPKRKAILEQVYGYFPRLAQRSQQVAGYLSGGEKQMLTIGMALLCEPALLLIDELSLGLAPIVTQSIMASLRTINHDLGVGLLVVEQNAVAALSIASYAYVMEGGRVVFKGTAAELLQHQDVKEFYLGGSATEARSYRNIRQYSRKRRWWG